MSRLAPAAYRALLSIAPRRLRRRYGPDMVAVFADALADAADAGARAVAVAWLRAFADLLSARIREPIDRRDPSPGPAEREVVMLSTDLRYTFRWLGREKFSTSLVVGMLALGIAANVVVFSLVDGLFLRPFPFRQPERLVYINETAPRWNLDVVGVNYPDFVQWRQHVTLFDAIAAWDEVSFNVSDGNTAERIDGATVTYDFPIALGIAPVRGRMFTPEEDRPKAPPVVLIGQALWRQRYSSDPNVLGRTLRLNGVAHEIIGVLPKAAEFPARIQLWVPLAGDPAQPGQSYGLSGVGRLKPGVSAEDGEKDLLRAHQAIWEARDKEKIVSPYAHPLRQEFARNFKAQARALLVATSILMIVACANVASVMLARALARRREIAIRLAVGASRARLAQQLLVENLVLSALGGTVGLLLGMWALRALVAAAGDQVPPWATFTLDWRIAVFTVLLAVATALLFGWAPAFHAIRGSLRGALHEAGTGTTATPGARRTLSFLVGAEFALAAILLVCGGLLLRAYDRVQRVDPGFRLERVLTFSLSLPQATYSCRRTTAPCSRGPWDSCCCSRQEPTRCPPGTRRGSIR
ncbi:MAG: hypothetical protein A3H96_04945 [Acidobacteria bacterium RIFCSPLOWO2_02_FULL_67_36]|nr:MAG: hypothetical protein A3H96_04945 [Acidobacteria bacterium RIFCSPLOWO2_02_FULL_67_36]OFW26421.1 MAG: hypothetical protein A3G21_27465 [Acidobacteria bacterium RIFCSPLOWO2_12_FULL_66_21]